jgi:hypothetical protein
MTLSSRAKQTIIGSGLVIFLLIASVVYAYIQSRNLIYGPSITILSPADGSNLDNPVVTLRGTVKNVAELSLNDRRIYPNEKGDFTETLVLPSGYTIISIKAADKFGKKTEQTLSLTVNENKQ